MGMAITSIIIYPATVESEMKLTLVSVRLVVEKR